MFDLKTQLFWQLADVQAEHSSCIVFVPQLAQPSRVGYRGVAGGIESNFANLVLIGTSTGKIYAVNFGIYLSSCAFFFIYFSLLYDSFNIIAATI